MSDRRTAVRADWIITMDGPGDGAGAGQTHGGLTRGELSAGVIRDGVIVFDRSGILELGPAAAMAEPCRGIEVEHLRGHVLLPGLINAHTHLAMTMFRGLADDRNLDDFLATLLPLEADLLNHERVRAATRAALVESHLAGVTTALDMYFFCDAVLDAAQEVGARVMCGPVVLDASGPDAAPGSWETRMGHTAEWLDRHPPGDDWRPVVGPHSTYTVSPEHLAEAGRTAQGGGALLHLHAAETEAEMAMVRQSLDLRPVELLDQLELLGPSTVLAHGVHLNDSEIDRLAETGTAMVHCPASNLKLSSGIAPVRTMLEAGVAVALGTDGPASSNDLDLLGAVRLAALAHKTSAPEGPDPTCLPAAQVLSMATRNGAKALGFDGRLGVLRSGAMADLVAIDLDRAHTQPVHDVCSSVVYAAGRGDVSDVWSRGRRVVRGGRHQFVSEAEVVSDLRGLGEVVRARR